MTFPHWVTTGDEYVRWLADIVERSGGFLERPYLWYEPLGSAEQLGVYYDHTIVVDQHTLSFPRVGSLEFRLLICERFTLDWEPIEVFQAEYHYHFRTESHQMLWRHDKHGAHPGVTSCHVHRVLGNREVVESCDEVDLDDVVGIIHRDHMP